MPDYLKHITVDQVRYIAALSDDTYDVWLADMAKGGKAPIEWLGADLYSALEKIRLGNPSAYAELLVLMWIGRGDCAPRDWDEQVEQTSHTHFDSDYVVRKGSLTKWFETALWALGYEAFPDQAWIDEYRFQRWSHGDPDHADAEPKHDPIPPLPFDIADLGDETTPLKHLSIEDVLNIMTLRASAKEELLRIDMHVVADRVARGLSWFPNNLEPDFKEWHRKMEESLKVKAFEAGVLGLSLEARIELSALFYYGKDKRKGGTRKEWRETVEMAAATHNRRPDATDFALMAAYGPIFNESITNGLQKLGLRFR